MSIGRVASRLWAGVFAWAIATVAAMNALAWYNWDGKWRLLAHFSELLTGLPLVHQVPSNSRTFKKALTTQRVVLLAQPSWEFR